MKQVLDQQFLCERHRIINTIQESLYVKVSCFIKTRYQNVTSEIPPLINYNQNQTFTQILGKYVSNIHFAEYKFDIVIKLWKIISEEKPPVQRARSSNNS